MTSNLLQGDLVELAAYSAERDGETLLRWTRDTEYWRLLDTSPAPAWTLSQARDFIRREFETDASNTFMFAIRTRADQRLIGDIGLDGIRWTHGDAFVGIGIGEREYWGKGYGTDAMRVIVRFAFEELNLHRVSLSVYAYNPRAMRSYEKAGFRVEGRTRQRLLRDGQRYDVIYMGILKSEWQMMNS